MMTVQEQLWKFLAQAGPVLWWIEPILCLVGFVILLLRAPPACWLERVGRYLCFLGLLCIMGALLNSALAPIGRSVFFLGYALTLVHRRTVEHRVGVVRPPPLPGGTPQALMLFILCVIMLVAVPALALGQDGRHGVGHAQHHDWYKTLITPHGTSCCNNEDCRPTRAYRDDDGAWHALLDGRWITVPREKVLNTKAPDGNSHICANPFGMIFCFVGGVPKS